MPSPTDTNKSTGFPWLGRCRQSEELFLVFGVNLVFCKNDSGVKMGKPLPLPRAYDKAELQGDAKEGERS